MSITRIFNRRTQVTLAVALAAGIGSAAGVGFAQDAKPGGGTSAAGAQKTQPASTPASGGIMVAVHAALERLVSEGTINQRQADVVESEAAAGSIDPRALVQSGTVDEAQMRAIGTSLDKVKEAAAAAGN